MGTKNEPKTNAGMRNSGFPLPPFFLTNCVSQDGLMSAVHKHHMVGGVAYVCVYLVSKVSAEQRCEEEANAESNVCQAACADAEAVYAREDLCEGFRTQIRYLTAATTYRGR